MSSNFHNDDFKAKPLSKGNSHCKLREDPYKPTFYKREASLVEACSDKSAISILKGRLPDIGSCYQS
jgi:hypothetical protein